MNILIAPLLAILCLAVDNAMQLANEIRHLQLDNADLIETSPINFGLSAPVLWQNNWKTVSVNENNVLIYDQGCQLITRQISSLSPNEQSMLDNAKQQLASLKSNNQQMFGSRVRSGLASYSMLAGQSATSSSSQNMNTFSFNSNGYSITRHDENNFSISRPDLPYNTNRIFVDGDTVTFVYNDGRVLMRPASCLNGGEQQLIAKLNSEMQLAEQQFHANMQQMQQSLQQNMRNMHQSIQQNMQNTRFRMQNLRQNLNGMFPQQQQQQQQYYRSPSYAPTRSFGNSIDGNDFPFGPNNSPFGANFPFSR